MTGNDPFLDDDAPFVLGLLGIGDRLAFEAHLLVCDACRSRVDQLTGTVALLAEVEPAEAEALVAAADRLPDTSLPALLRRAGVVRTRRRVFTGMMAGAAAAAAALVVALWPASAPHPSGGPRQMVALVDSPLAATAAVTPAADGTRISLACRYLSSSAYPLAAHQYALAVVDTTGTTHRLGTWTVSGQGETGFTKDVALPRSAIRQVEITTIDREPVLSLQLRGD